MKLTNRVAVVIGATGHLGRALVARLLQEDCRVAAVARSHSELEELRQCHQTQRDLLSLHAKDIRVEAQVHDLFREIKAGGGEIDFLIYSAGIKPDPDVCLADYSLNSWNETISIYLTGYFLCLREALNVLAANGHIIVVSSAATRFTTETLPSIHAGHYAAAKAAVDELSKWARRDAHDRKLLLSRIAPGALDMPFHLNAPACRPPVAVLPASAVACKVVDALIRRQECDQMMIAPAPRPAE